MQRQAWIEQTLRVLLQLMRDIDAVDAPVFQQIVTSKIVQEDLEEIANLAKHLAQLNNEQLISHNTNK